MKNLQIFYLILLTGFLFTSCDPKEPASSSTTSQEINIDVKPKSAGKDIELNKYVLLKNGDSILVSRLDFYMQNISFQNKSGSKATLDTVFLFSMKNTAHKLRFKSSSLPTSIDSIGFLCGLGDMTNSLDPNNYDSDHPLSSYKNMYWTMGSKYRFVVLEGNIKSSTGTIIPYSFHTGLEYKYMASVPASIVLDVQNPKTYSLNLNIDKVFFPTNGTDVYYRDNETQAHGDINDAALTRKVALNFSKAFSLE